MSRFNGFWSETFGLMIPGSRPPVKEGMRQLYASWESELDESGISHGPRSDSSSGPVDPQQTAPRNAGPIGRFVSLIPYSTLGPQAAKLMIRAPSGMVSAMHSRTKWFLGFQTQNSASLLPAELLTASWRGVAKPLSHRPVAWRRRRLHTASNKPRLGCRERPSNLPTRLGGILGRLGNNPVPSDRRPFPSLVTRPPSVILFCSAHREQFVNMGCRAHLKVGKAELEHTPAGSSGRRRSAGRWATQPPNRCQPCLILARVGSANLVLLAGSLHFSLFVRSLKASKSGPKRIDGIDVFLIVFL
jgi:hypothetical protein